MAAVLAARLCPGGRALLCLPVRESKIWTAFCKALAGASLQAKVRASLMQCTCIGSCFERRMLAAHLPSLRRVASQHIHNAWTSSAGVELPPAGR